MKFADLKVIHRRFFYCLKSNEKSKSDWWARERIGLLKSHGFLLSKRISFSGASYFLATDLAHAALSNLRSHRSFVRPLLEIDVRTFEHDRRITDSRLVLEKLGRASNWISERRLKSENALTFGLPRLYQPDGIYQNKLNDLVAFELELSSKTRQRYEDKVRKYVEVIRQGRQTKEGFQGVLFIVCQETIFKMLGELTGKYEGMFRVEKFEELMRDQEINSQIGGI